MEKRIVFLAMFLLVFCRGFLVCTYADTKVQIKDGNLKFTTQDTKAVSGIKWKTVGFTVTMKKCMGSTGNGGYPAKYQHATVMLSDGSVSTKDLHNGKVQSVFTIPESKLTTALMQAGFGDVIIDGGTVYLNGIFQVTYNGSNHGGRLDNLNAIKYAEAWRNPDDFNDRFDIAVVYNAAPQKITIKYVDENNKVLKSNVLAKKMWKKPGQSFSVTLDSACKYKNNTYTIDASYFTYDNEDFEQRTYKCVDYGYNVSEIRKVSSRMRLGGVTVYAVMVKDKEKEKNKEDDVQIPFGNENDLRNIARIYSMDYQNEKYNVLKAIPSGENVYCKATVDRYLYSGKYEKHSGCKNYKIKITARYKLVWKEAILDSNGRTNYIDRTKNVEKTKTVSVQRDYSYWKIKDIALYYIDDVAFNNSVLNAQVVVDNKTKCDNCERHIYNVNLKEPVYDKEIVLPVKTIDGGNYEPSEPTMNYMEKAQTYIGQIKVRNDGLIIGGKTFSDTSWFDTTTKKPKVAVASSYKRIQLLKQNISIPVDRQNGLYVSKANAVYKKVFSNMQGRLGGEKVNKNISDINDINVHTPVCCDGRVSNDLKYCQLVDINMDAAQLILGRNFTVAVSNEGNHINSKGYYYRDYKRYVKADYVKFPFDVYVGNKYIVKNTWTKMKENTLECYIPVWTKEGEYTVEFKSIAINEPFDGKYKLGKDANKNISQYGATDKVKVVVSGRLYGMSVYDVSDYPLWESVFRTKDKSLSGVNYMSGIFDKDHVNTGRKKIFTLPFMEGSHPLISNAGVLKPGYLMRMSLCTIGQMHDDNDYIRIKPKFYVVDNKGNRTEADVFYTESFTDAGGKNMAGKLIKIGGKYDNRNIKKVCIGDEMMGVDKSDINRTAQIKNINPDEYNNAHLSTYTFDNIMVNSGLQVYKGSDFNTKKLPQNISENEVNSCVQKWYFHYYLPGDLHVAIKDSVDENAKYVDFSDACWIKDGYLVLSFDIYTINDGDYYLSYSNTFNNEIYGACNMWKTEGMDIKKTDYKGNRFNINYGDIALFNLKKSVHTDYVSGGTH